MKVTNKNRVDCIIEYEQGGLNDEDILELFSYLIETGICWQLQGHYGRTAGNLIESGLINKQGVIL